MSLLKEELERSRTQIEEMKLQLSEKHQEESKDRDSQDAKLPQQQMNREGLGDNGNTNV